MLAEDFTDWLSKLTVFSDVKDIVEGRVPATFDDTDEYSVSVDCPEGIPVAGHGRAITKENTVLTVAIFANKLSTVRAKTRALKDEFHNYVGDMGTDTRIVKSDLITQGYTRPNPQTDLNQSTMAFNVLTQPQ